MGWAEEPEVIVVKMTRVTYIFDNIVLLKNKIETIDENLTKTIRLLGDMNGRVINLGIKNSK